MPKDNDGNWVYPLIWEDTIGLGNVKFYKEILGIGRGNIVFEKLLGGRIEPRSIDIEELESTPEYVTIRITPRKSR